MSTLISSINYFILLFFVFSAIVYTLLLFCSIPELIGYFNRATLTNVYALLKSKELPPVTIITSFYNESKRIKESVLSALHSDYKNLYVMLVNDGSTDNSVDILIDAFGMKKVPLSFEQKIKTANVLGIYVSDAYPNLILIDKEHSAVGDSLNVGLNACFTPFFITVDADSTIDKEAVSELMFDQLTNAHTISVGGAVYLRNACTYSNGEMQHSQMPYRLIPALQSNEYLRSHVFNRTGWNKMGSTMSYSGTCTLFSTRSVLEVGGFDTQNFSQDTEMAMRLHQHMHKTKQPYQIRFNPAAAVWTDVPATFKSFSIQRDRWHRGIIRSALRHKGMFFNPKYKIQGLLSYPFYVLLEIIAPFIEFTAYVSVGVAYYLGILDGTSVLLYILLAWGFTTYLTLANMLINLITFNQYKRFIDIIWIFLLTAFEMFGFRQYYTSLKIFSSFHYLINRLCGKPL